MHSLVWLIIEILVLKFMWPILSPTSIEPTTNIFAWISSKALFFKISWGTCIKRLLIDHFFFFLSKLLIDHLLQMENMKYLHSILGRTIIQPEVEWTT